jgi:hypothetical protein
MTEDVFASWKENRFVVADFPKSEFGGIIIVLTDVEYWNTHYEELKDWCDENLADTQGMTVTIPNKKVLTLFCLRWS